MFILLVDMVHGYIIVWKTQWLLQKNWHKKLINPKKNNYCSFSLSNIIPANIGSSITIGNEYLNSATGAKNIVIYNPVIAEIATKYFFFFRIIHIPIL